MASHVDPAAPRSPILIQPEDLVRSPAVYPYMRWPSGVAALRLSEANYRAASFLDERIAGPDPPGELVDRSVLAEAAAHLPRRANFIFHLGHVGSTLLARLLGESPGVFCVREPALLRPLAQSWTDADAQGADELDVLMRLYSRTWQPAQTALVKATSFVCELADDLLAQDPAARALAMSATPPAYLRTILGGPASRVEVRALADLRRARLQRRLGGPIDAVSEGEWIAMTWLCEALCLDSAAARHGERVLWMDFDRFLADPAHGLAAALAYIDPTAPPELAPALAAGELMRRYSKAPEHAYGPDLRRAVLDQAQRNHGEAVRSGLDWLQRMADRHPAVVGPLRRAADAARRVGAGPAAR